MFLLYDGMIAFRLVGKCNKRTGENRKLYLHKIVQIQFGKWNHFNAFGFCVSGMITA